MVYQDYLIVKRKYHQGKKKKFLNKIQESGSGNEGFASAREQLSPDMGLKHSDSQFSSTRSRQCYLAATAA